MASLSEYDINFQKPIGRGTFGTVFKAKENKTKSVVAVKQMYYGKGHDTRGIMKDMAIKELKAIASCHQHPYIVCLLAHFEENDSLWMVLEYCDQGDLFDYLANKIDSLTRLDISTFMLQTTSAVAFMHNQNPPIIHRDIKLTNILMQTIEGKIVAKVCDFGLARIYESDSRYSQAFKLQMMNSTQGTTLFMAPEFSAEMKGGTKYTPSVDVYALGLVFLVLLEPNRPDFCPLSVESKKSKAFVSIGYEMVQRHKEDKPLPTVIEDAPNDDNITRRLKRIIRHMTKLKFYERKSILEVEEELKEIVNELTVKTDSQSQAACNTGAVRHQTKTSFNQDATFRRTKERIQKNANSLAVIQGNIWVCCNDGIHVVDLELDDLFMIPKRNMGSVFSASDTGSGVIIAAEKGLFLLSYQGKTEKHIDARKFRDARYNKGLVYTLPSKSPSKIEVFEEKTWKHKKSIKTGCDSSSHLHTLSLFEEYIIVACNGIINSQIDKINLVTEEVSTIGFWGDATGEVKQPRISHAIVPDGLLVVETQNTRVQFLTRTEWHVLLLVDSLYFPIDVVHTHRALYVLEDGVLMMNSRIRIFKY